MKEIVEQIVQQEEKAREEVETAKVEAKKKRLEAEQEADRIIRDIQMSSKQETRDLFQKAENEALAQKEQELNKSVKSAEKIWKENKKEIEQTIENFVDFIIQEQTRA